MNFVSLFAGVGGFDLAFERAGMVCQAQVEIDAKCREVLAKHWPEVPRWEDVHDVTAGRIQMAAGGRSEHANGNRLVSATRGGADSGDVLLGGNVHGGTEPVDVLCGGFPCQDYSVAGKRGGLVGDRGALWWQFHRLIAECRPRWVVGENVPGLLSSNDGRDFGAIVGSLVELGYGVVWRVLDAQYFGVAQRRRRVFIVGHSGGIPRPEILAFAEGCTGDTPPRREAGKGVAALTHNGLGGGGPDDNLAQAGHLISTRHMHDPDREGFAQTVTARTGARYDPETETLIAFNWQSGQDQLSVREHYTDALHAGQTPAISNGQVRRLTPLECERLQGFPDNWTTGQSDTQRYRQMGNAVAVPVVEWIGRNLAKAT